MKFFLAILVFAMSIVTVTAGATQRSVRAGDLTFYLDESGLVTVKSKEHKAIIRLSDTRIVDITAVYGQAFLRDEQGRILMPDKNLDIQYKSGRVAKMATRILKTGGILSAGFAVFGADAMTIACAAVIGACYAIDRHSDRINNKYAIYSLPMTELRYVQIPDGPRLEIDSFTFIHANEGLNTPNDVMIKAGDYNLFARDLSLKSCSGYLGGA